MIQDDIDHQNGIHRGLIHCVRTPSPFVPPRLSPSLVVYAFSSFDKTASSINLLVTRTLPPNHPCRQFLTHVRPQPPPHVTYPTLQLVQFDDCPHRPSLLLFLLAHSMTVKHHAFKSSHQQPLVLDRWIRMASHETIPTSASDFPILTTPRSSPPRPLKTSYSTARTSW